VQALEKTFDNPPRYGKGVSWDGFTIHDCAALVLRYLKCLPEPVIPYEYYDQFARKFQEELQTLPDGRIFNRNTHDSLIKDFQRNITKLPSLSRQLLLYLLDMLAVFASKSNLNKMECSRLVSVFHPAILSQRPQKMDEAEHRLAQDVVIFLVDNQDNFLIGMASMEI
jgi:GTPase-activating protein SAC7